MDDPELAAIRARKRERLERLVTNPSARSAVSPAQPVAFTDATFDAEVAKGGLILVDFWAAWCGPCRRVSPVLEGIARDHSRSLTVGKLNVDENPRTAARFQVMSIPTLLLFKDGKLVDGIVGAVPRAQIESLVSRWK